MRIFRRSLIVSLSVVTFLFMLPFQLMQGAVKRLAGVSNFNIGVRELYAEVFYQVDEALKTLLPGAADVKEEIKVLTVEQKKLVQEKAEIELDPEFDKEFHFYVSASGTAVVDTIKGKWGPIKLMLVFDKEGKVKDTIVLELLEKRGRPVKERKFLDQFTGKSILDPIKLKKDIKGIAGATISSRQMTNGIRKLVNIYELFYKK